MFCRWSSFHLLSNISHAKTSLWFISLLFFREVPILELVFTSRSFLYKQVCSLFSSDASGWLITKKHRHLLVITESNPGLFIWIFVALQVRRMAGALVAVGQGRLSVAQLKEVLEARDSLAYPQGLAAPAHGLFLTRVDYSQTGTFHLMKLRAGARTVSHAENPSASSDLQFSPQTTNQRGWDRLISLCFL